MPVFNSNISDVPIFDTYKYPVTGVVKSESKYIIINSVNSGDSEYTVVDGWKQTFDEDISSNLTLKL